MCQLNFRRGPVKTLTTWLIFLFVFKFSYAVQDPDVEGVVKFAVIPFLQG